MGRLVRLARTGRLRQLETEWLETLEGGSPDLSEMLDAAEHVARKGGGEQAAILLWALAGSLPETLSPEQKLETYRKAVGLVPADRTLREHLPAILGQVHRNPELIDSVLAAIPAGTASKDTLELAERCLALHPGSYIEHRSGEIAQVEAYRPEKGVFSLRSGKGSESVEVAALEDYRLLPRGNLRALLLFERDRLQKLRDDDPVELVRIVVAGMGGSAGWRQVRARLLEEKLLAPRTWGPWWSAAKRQMEAAGLFELTASGEIVLRETPLSPAEVVQRALSGADTLQGRAQALLDELLRLGQRAEESREELQKLLERVGSRGREAVSDDPWGSYLLMMAAVMGGRELGFEMDAWLPGRLPAVPDDPLLETSEKLLERALELSREISPSGWTDWWCELWPKLTTRLSERAAAELLAHGFGARLLRVMSEAATRPDAYPNAFLWLWKTTCGPQGRYQGPLPTINPLTLTFSLLGLADRMTRPQSGVGDTELRKAFLGRLRGALRSDDYAAFRRIVHEADTALLRRLRTSISNSRALGTALREALLEIVRTRRIAPDVPAWERDDVIWVTRRSLKRRREELDRVLKVDIPANSRAIGEAASRGDLSENAEWAAALDQQKLLASRAAQMQKELSMARALTAEGVTPDVVGVGSAVVAEDLDSTERRWLTFLGPWDADHEAGIYSYLAPISKAFMGKKVGEIVELPGSPKRRCRICEVRTADALGS